MENSSWKLAKTLHVNLSAFSMITRKNKSKTLTKAEHVIQIKSGITIFVNL